MLQAPPIPAREPGVSAAAIDRQVTVRRYAAVSTDYETRKHTITQIYILPP